MNPNSVSDADDRRARRQARFEGDRVMMVLEAFGLDEHKWPLVEAHAAEYGTKRLTFEMFRRRFPTFPLVLAATYSGGLATDLPAADLFRRFSYARLCRLYTPVFHRLAEEAGGRPVGLVVPCGVHSGLTLHNGPPGRGGTWMTHDVPGDAPPHRITAETFRRLLHRTAAGGWTPDARTGGSTMAVTRSPDATAPIAPWMVRRLGTGPGLVVYLWLTAMLSSPAYVGCVVRGSDGERHLTLTRAELAATTGMSEDAVKRGLRQLTGEGLVTTWAKDRRTYILVNTPVEPPPGDG